jgi:F0F1-type ATP synthase membrane subunit b/b'
MENTDKSKAFFAFLKLDTGRQLVGILLLISIFLGTMVYICTNLIVNSFNKVIDSKDAELIRAYSVIDYERAGKEKAQDELKDFLIDAKKQEDSLANKYERLTEKLDNK